MNVSLKFFKMLKTTIFNNSFVRSFLYTETLFDSSVTISEIYLVTAKLFINFFGKIDRNIFLATNKHHRF